MAMALQGVSSRVARAGRAWTLAAVSAAWAIATLGADLGGVQQTASRAIVRSMVADELMADSRAGFAERDLDLDGVLTRREVPYLKASTFQRVDADGDGRITRGEALPSSAELAQAATQAEHQLRMAFEQLDANRSGALEAIELHAFAGPMGANVGPLSYQGFAHGLKTLNTLPAAAAGTEERNPVIMLPGFLMPASSFGMMKRALAEAGYHRFKVLDRWPWFSDIHEYAAAGKFYADRLRQRTGATRLEMLGHSMGGLVGRVMIEQLGYEPYVNHYVSFGTPHHGTVLGPLACLYAKSAVQMTPRSDFLKALNAREGHPSAIRYTSIHAGLDEIVLPHSSVDLAGAANPEIPKVFHIPMPMMPEVCSATVEALAR